MYIIGGLDDQTSLLVWEQLSHRVFGLDNPALLMHAPYAYAFYGHVRPWLTSQPIIWGFASLFLSFWSFNAWIILTLVLNLIASFLLFRRFKFGFLYSLVFAFSAYTWIHLGIHMELLQLWIFPIFILLLFKLARKPGFSNSIFLGLFISVSILVSNYYGFFVLLLFGLWFVFKQVSTKRLDWVLAKWVGISMFFGVTVAGFCVIPYVRSTFFSGTEVIHIVARGDRTYDDFFTFSSRPWYYVLPPVKNPWVGSVSKNILEKIAATKYFLADDYFAGEHSGSYFGIPLLLVFGIAVICILIKGSGQEERNKALTFAGIAFMFLLFSFPPFFTISGVTIWTPGYLLYKFFPMFRVTTRLSIVILLCILISLGYAVKFFYKQLSDSRRWILSIIMPFIFALTLFGMFLPIKIQVVDGAPPLYKYLSDNTPLDTKFSVYPYSQTTEAFYWLFEHDRYLLNMREYFTFDFDSELFTNNLVTSDGIKDLKKLGGTLLIVFKNVSEEELDFFKSSDQLLLEEEFMTAYIFEIL